MLNSSEYNESFGEDTVPFERFITPADRNARQVPTFNRAFNAAAYAEPAALRPDVTPPQALRSTGDLVQRNLADRNRVIVGSWTAQLSGGAVASPNSPSPSQGPGSIRQDPAPTRRWRPTTIGFASAAGFAGSTPASQVSTGATWRSTVGDGRGGAPAAEPGAAMARALRGGQPQGFNRRKSLGQPVQLGRTASETDVQTAIEATYKQLLNRVPFAAERLGDVESQFRNQQLTVAEFVGQLAGSDCFQQRLNRMAPLRAASAAYLALLGRAAKPQEVSRFLATRAKAGQQAALEGLLSSNEYAQAFGQNTVPYVRGMATADGLPLTSVNRTASLYAGNAGLNPSPKAAI
jgi:phycobilisome core-membrane linker protein